MKSKDYKNISSKADKAPLYNIDFLQSIILVLDKNGKIIDINDYALQSIGYDKEDVIERYFVDFLVSEIYIDDMKNTFHEAISNKTTCWNLELEIINKTKNKILLSCKNSLIKDNEGNVDYIILVCENITEYRKIEKNLQKTVKSLSEEREKERAIIDSTDNILIEDNGSEIIDCNQKFLDFFGYSSLTEFKEEYIGLSRNFIKHKDFFDLSFVDHESDWIEYMKNLPDSKRIVSMQDSESNVHAFKVDFRKFSNSSHIITFTDVTDMLIEKNHFKYQANHDSLTKIYNRQKLNTILKGIINNQRNENTKHSLIMFDIDNFKKINDTYGHDIGDNVLKSLANLFRESLRQNDIFARWGGEEFMILLSNSSVENALQKAEKLRILLEEHKDNQLPKITSSFGVTSVQENDSMQSLLKRVDNALYSAKKQGKNQVVAI